jgi:hypothetical protein
MRDTVATNSAYEGVMNLDLEVVSARTSDLMTWNGAGRASLTNGLIWDVPVFGFLSPVLDGLAPGLGSQRFDRATADFTITDGVIRTTNLVMDSSAVRLAYRGTLDMERNVNLRVEANAFRNVALVGPLMGLLTAPLTKLLEFRVTGTLGKPEPEPVFVPSFFLWPFKLLGRIVGGDREEDDDDDAPPPALVGTNAPPE